MDLAIDIGNTSTKVGFFEKGQLQQVQNVPIQALPNWLAKTTARRIVAASVAQDANQFKAHVPAQTQWLTVTAQIPLPFKVHYATPNTLGADRICAVAGGQCTFPGQNCLVIDAGTCITYDYITATGHYKGGAIAPGLHMKLKALNNFTERLPLVELPQNTIMGFTEQALVGQSTHNAILSGVVLGTMAEIQGTIAQYKRLYGDIKVILCGGDTIYLDKGLNDSIFVSPNLVLLGLHHILAYNASA